VQSLRPLARGLAIVAFFAALATSSGHAQATEFTDVELKAALIGKIVGFMRWPSDAGLDDPERPFELVILGPTPLDRAFKQLYGKVRIAGHRVFVRTTRDLGDVGRPHLLFIAPSFEADLDRIFSTLGTSPVLTAGDTEGFAARGVAINLYRDNDHVRFEISRRALSRSRLQASYQLLSHARLVDEPDER
jgi:hypothetical protein